MRTLRLTILGLLVAACAGRVGDGGPADSTFAGRIAALSEPGGYFDTDNLISNEASYLHAMGPMRELGVEGGAYIGVGPDQNFSYIAQIRPRIAFIIDIRRDNLLQQLLFKALFAEAQTRVEYLALLFGRPTPDDLVGWRDRDIEELVAYVDGTGPEPGAVTRARTRVDTMLARLDVPLSRVDLATIDRFHRTFITAGLSLRFQTHGRAPRSYYPTYRDLLLERDLTGRRANYLASEDAYQVVRALQQRDRIVPVVGDLAGPHALSAIGRLLAEQGEQVSAFYTSNVEFYLFRDGTFDAFVSNVAELPMSRKSVVIRSVFHTFFGPHPLSVPGYVSTQLVEPLLDLPTWRGPLGLAGYWQLVTGGIPD